MKIIDVKGFKCPMPLIETKKALKEAKKDETLKIIIDNETSFKNVTHYLEDNNIPTEFSIIGGNYEIIVNKGEEDLEGTQAEAWCTTETVKDESYVVVFGKNTIGEGSDELGGILIGAMLNSLIAQEVVPKKIMFMNSGITLVLKDSVDLPLVQKLEQKGSEIVTCGTCLDYLGKSDELGVGRVTNMFDIVESMRTAGRVINI